MFHENLNFQLKFSLALKSPPPTDNFPLGKPLLKVQRGVGRHKKILISFWWICSIIIIDLKLSCAHFKVFFLYFWLYKLRSIWIEVRKFIPLEIFPTYIIFFFFVEYRSDRNASRAVQIVISVSQYKLLLNSWIWWMDLDWMDIFCLSRSMWFLSFLSAHKYDSRQNTINLLFWLLLLLLLYIFLALLFNRNATATINERKLYLIDATSEICIY